MQRKRKEMLEKAIELDWTVQCDKGDHVTLIWKLDKEQNKIPVSYMITLHEDFLAELDHEMEKFSTDEFVHYWLSKRVTGKSDIPDAQALVTTATVIRRSMRKLRNAWDVITKGEGENRLWIRAGISVFATREEYETICGDDSTKAAKLLREKIESGKYMLDGETYIPRTRSAGKGEWPVFKETEFQF